MISIDYHRLLTNQINAKFSLKKNKKDTESQILSFQSSLSSFYRNLICKCNETFYMRNSGYIQSGHFYEAYITGR